MNEDKAIDTTAVVVHEQRDVVRAEDFMPLMTVQQAVERKNQINQFIGKVFKDGEDFGVIPGARNVKVLLKPGAEKLCSIFGMQPTYAPVQVVEDWTGDEHRGEPLFYYEYRCQLSRGGRFMGEAIGSANSWESKYRYRWVSEDVAKQRADWEDLPRRGGQRTIFEPFWAIDKSETGGKYGKPAEYWQRLKDAIAADTGKRMQKQLGGKTQDGYAITVDETQYRIPNPEVADVINTLQKMAQKRALVAAVLVVTNCSDAFSQDLEDLEPERGPVPQAEEHEPGPSGGSSSPATGGGAPRPAAAGNGGNGAATAPPAEKALPVPEELRVTFENIDKGAEKFSAVFLRMEDSFVAKGGRPGQQRYATVIKEFRQRIPPGKETKGDMKNVLVELFHALQAMPDQAEPKQETIPA